MVCLVWVLSLMDWEVLNLRQLNFSKPSFVCTVLTIVLLSPPPLKWYSCFHCLYYLWASQSYPLLLIFHYCSCSSKIPSILFFYFKSGFLQLITLCTAAFFSFDLYAPSQRRGTFGLHEGSEALRAHILMRWLEIPFKYSTNICNYSIEKKVYMSVFTAGVFELCEVALWSEWCVLNSEGITCGLKNSLVARERNWAVHRPCLYSLCLHCPVCLRSWGSPRQMWALLILLSSLLRHSGVCI